MRYICVFNLSLFFLTDAYNWRAFETHTRIDLCLRVLYASITVSVAAVPLDPSGSHFKTEMAIVTDLNFNLVSQRAKRMPNALIGHSYAPFERNGILRSQVSFSVLGSFHFASHIATRFKTCNTLTPHTYSTTYAAHIMFSRPVPAILGAILLSCPVFAANPTDWSSRSIYQVNPPVFSCLCPSHQTRITAYHRSVCYFQ